MAHRPAHTMLSTSDRFVIIMVGLPARGKSYMGKKIARYMRHLNITAKIFNCGSYRRIATKNATVGKASANFFDPQNAEAVRIRTQCCLDAMNDMCSWFKSPLNAVGILDATNTTLERRRLVREFFAKKQHELDFNVKLLHCESICNDQSVIDQNIIRAKLKNPDYCTVDKQKAISDFNKRIEMYKKRYTPVQKEEGSYIKVIDVGVEHQTTSTTPQNSLKSKLASPDGAFKNDDISDISESTSTLSANPASTFATPGTVRTVPSLAAPWMHRQSFRMWSEPENTYNNTKSTPSPLHSAFNDSISEVSAHSSPMKCTPRRTPLQQSPIRPTMMPRTKSVRRSTLVINSIQERDGSATNSNDNDNMVNIPNDVPLMTVQESETSSTVGMDNEVDSSPMAEVTESKEDEIADEVEDEVDDEVAELASTFSSRSNCNEIICELCGRSVQHKDSKLVDSKDDEDEKVRICEVCLYETDSEEDEMEEDEPFLEPSFSVTPNPSVFESSMNVDQEHKVKELSETINHVLSDFEKDHDEEHVKEELLKLKEGISLMFHTNADRAPFTLR